MLHDIYLGGPRDNPIPTEKNQRVLIYKEPIKQAFKTATIYDWEEYHGDNYQEQNHQAIRNSKIMIAMVPPFPLPGIGLEIGYFYCYHENLIKSQPNISRIIIIWPNDIRPDFTKKTLSQYGIIVETVGGAIELAQNSLYTLSTNLTDTVTNDACQQLELDIEEFRKVIGAFNFPTDK
jgi:hypothetical protein